MSPLITPFIVRPHGLSPSMYQEWVMSTPSAEMNIKKHGNSEVWRTAEALTEVFWHSIRYLFISLLYSTVADTRHDKSQEARPRFPFLCESATQSYYTPHYTYTDHVLM